jgi:hypothetical protein
LGDQIITSIASLYGILITFFLLISYSKLIEWVIFALNILSVCIVRQWISLSNSESNYLLQWLNVETYLPKYIFSKLLLVSCDRT